jgi:prophage antirepressor-like protein
MENKQISKKIINAKEIFTMDNNLKLITTEKFGELDYSFYRNMNDDILLTREQIGQALEYKDPIKSIQNIHMKHKDRLDHLSLKIKTETFDHHQSDVCRNNNLMTERVYYTERGIMEICRWSRQPKADEFMDWVWDIVEKYRNNTFTSINLQPIIKALENLIQAQNNMTQAVNLLYERYDTDIAQLNERLTLLENNMNTFGTISNKKMPYWVSIMMPKFKRIMMKYGIDDYKTLYRKLFKEFGEQYTDKDLNQMIDDYCHNNNLKNCMTMDALAYDKEYRSLFEEMVDAILDE